MYYVFLCIQHYVIFSFCSDEAYHAHMQLAAIDYNMHRDRPTVRGNNGLQYHRLFFENEQNTGMQFQQRPKMSFFTFLSSFHRFSYIISTWIHLYVVTKVGNAPHQQPLYLPLQQKILQLQRRDFIHHLIHQSNI